MSELTINDRVYRVQPLNGFKVYLAGEFLSQVFEAWPDVVDTMAQFRRKYTEQNPLRITQAMARLPRFAGLGLTEADFEAAGGTIDLPQEPDEAEILATVFPHMFRVARTQTLKLIALLVIPNDALEAADAQGEAAVDEALAGLARTLLHGADPGDLIDLVIDASDTIKDVWGKVRGLRKLGSLFKAEPQAEQKTASTSGPSSSIVSPPATAGPERKSSTESPGESSKVSAIS